MTRDSCLCFFLAKKPTVAGPAAVLRLAACGPSPIIGSPRVFQLVVAWRQSEEACLCRCLCGLGKWRQVVKDGASPETAGVDAAVTAYLMCLPLMPYVSTLST